MGSFGALCKISVVSIFYESMVIRVEHSFFGNLPFKKNNDTLKFLLPHDQNGPYEYKDIGYHGRIPAVTFRGNWPSFKNVVAL